MNDLRATVEMAEHIQTFIDSINELQFTIDDVNDVAFFRPDIVGVVSKIRDWLSNDMPYEGIGDFDGDSIDVIPKPVDEVLYEETRGDVVIENDEPEEVEEVTEEPPTSVTTRKKRVKLDDYNWIGHFVCTECDRMTLSQAKSTTFNKFKNKVSRNSINRFIDKKTHKDISDRFFTIEDNIIHVVEDHPLPSASAEIPTLLEKMKNKDKFFEIIGDMAEDDWHGGLVSLIKAQGSVETLYKMSVEAGDPLCPEALRDLEIIKRAMNMSGLCNAPLESFDMAIIVSVVVSKVGNKRKISRINNMIKKTWGISVKQPQEIYNIISKTEHKEISDMFFK